MQGNRLLIGFGRGCGVGQLENSLRLRLSRFGWVLEKEDNELRVDLVRKRRIRFCYR